MTRALIIVITPDLASFMIRCGSEIASLRKIYSIFMMDISLYPSDRNYHLRDDYLDNEVAASASSGNLLNEAVSYATLRYCIDVVLHLSDAHVSGGLTALLQAALTHSPCLATPSIELSNPDTCDSNELRPQALRTFAPRVSYKESRGLHVTFLGYPIAVELRETRAIASPIVAYTPSTHLKFGSWPTTTDNTHAFALSVSLKAWFSDCPIFILPPHLCRTTVHVSDFSDTRPRDVLARASACWGVFDIDTWERDIKRLYERISPGSGWSQEGNSSYYSEQHALFVRAKVKTDKEFFEEIKGPGKPCRTVCTSDACAALYCVGSGLGNVLLSVPALKALAELSGRPIDILDRGVRYSESLDLLGRQPFVRQVFASEPPVDLTPYKYVVGSFWADPPSDLPFGSYIGRVVRNWHQKHEVECNLDAVRALGYEGITPSIAICVDKVKGYSEEFRNYVAVGTGCGSYQLKQYPFWEKVCHTLASNKISLVFLGMSQDRRPWMREYGNDLTGSISLRAAASVLSSARLYLGVDNGLSHLAAAAGTPSIVLYGPSSDRKNRPWVNNAVILRSGRFSCSPCWGHPQSVECRYEINSRRPCMSAIEPNFVVSRVLEKMSEETGRSGTTRHVAATETIESLKLLANQQIYSVIANGIVGVRWARKFSTTFNRRLDIQIYLDESFSSGDASRKMIFDDLLQQAHNEGLIDKELIDSTYIRPLFQYRNVTTSGNIDLLHLGEWSEASTPRCLHSLLKAVRPGGFVLCRTREVALAERAIALLDQEYRLKVAQFSGRARFQDIILRVAQDSAYG